MNKCNTIKNVTMYYFEILLKLEVSEPKLVNPVLNIIGVNPLRLGGLQLMVDKSHCLLKKLN